MIVVANGYVLVSLIGAQAQNYDLCFLLTNDIARIQFLAVAPSSLIGRVMIGISMNCSLKLDARARFLETSSTKTADGTKYRWDEVQMGRSTDGTKYRWDEVQMGRSTDGTKYRWDEVQMGRSTDVTKYRWDEVQM